MGKIRKQPKPLISSRGNARVAKSRAEARFRAESNRTDGPPNLCVLFPSEAGQEPVSDRATWDGKEWLREPSETMTTFRRRVLDDLPVGGMPKVVVFLPRECNSAKANWNFVP